MSDSLVDEQCIESVTHGGSCCEGARRPVFTRPFNSRKNGPAVLQITEEMVAQENAEWRAGNEISQESIDAIKGTAEGTDALLAERAKDYGPPEINMTGIGLIWTAQLRNHFGIADLPVLSGQMVALMMAGLKLNRLAKSPGHQDSYDDSRGYLQIAENMK